jgi:hypothetical protein
MNLPPQVSGVLRSMLDSQRHANGASVQPHEGVGTAVCTDAQQLCPNANATGRDTWCCAATQNCGTDKGTCT